MSNIFDEALEIIIINAYMDSGDLGELNAKDRSIIEKALELAKLYKEKLELIERIAIYKEEYVKEEIKKLRLAENKIEELENEL